VFHDSLQLGHRRRGRFLATIEVCPNNSREAVQNDYSVWSILRQVQWDAGNYIM
jgi:hypothetical protein